MNINIYNYLQNFEDMDLPKENNILVEDDDRIKLIDDFGWKYFMYRYRKIYFWDTG